MSEAWPEVMESEAFGSEGEAGEAYGGEAYGGEAYGGEAYGGEAYGGEAFSGEASAADRRRQQQQILLARRQAELRRRRQPLRPVPSRPAPAPRPAPGPRPIPTQTITALRSDVRDLNLETKVDLDNLRRAVAEANRRAARATYSALATTAVSQGLDTFESNLADHPFVRAAARAAPLAILPGDPRRKGVAGVLLHPAFIGGVLVGGIVILGRITTTSKEVRNINITNLSPLTRGDKGTFVGTPVDGSGRNVQGIKLTWSSSAPAILDVKEGGDFEALTRGPAVVTASTDGVQNSIGVIVVDPPAESGGGS